MTLKAHVLLLAAGSGSRFGGSVPKQMLRMGDQPVFAHSFLVFADWIRIGQIVVSSRSDLVGEMQTLVDQLLAARPPATGKGSPTSATVVAGGASRHASAARAAAAILPTAQAGDLILIHDAARPFVSVAELERLVECFLAPDCRVASLVGRIHDTVVRGRAPGRLAGVLDRDELLSVKTPQAMRAEDLRRFIETPDTAELTDLLTWARQARLECSLTMCDPDNRKLTTAADLPVFEAIAARRASTSTAG